MASCVPPGWAVEFDRSSRGRPRLVLVGPNGEWARSLLAAQQSKPPRRRALKPHTSGSERPEDRLAREAVPVFEGGERRRRHTPRRLLRLFAHRGLRASDDLPTARARAERVCERDFGLEPPTHMLANGKQLMCSEAVRTGNTVVPRRFGERSVAAMIGRALGGDNADNLWDLLPLEWLQRQQVVYENKLSGSEPKLSAARRRKLLRPVVRDLLTPPLVVLRGLADALNQAANSGEGWLYRCFAWDIWLFSREFSVGQIAFCILSDLVLFLRKKKLLPPRRVGGHDCPLCLGDFAPGERWVSCHPCAPHHPAPRAMRPRRATGIPAPGMHYLHADCASKLCAEAEGGAMHCLECTEAVRFVLPFEGG